MSKAYHPLAVANQMIRIGNKHGIPLAVMQLSRMVYLADGWSLAMLNKALVSQLPEAWQWGPVYPEIYKAFSRFGTDPITALARDRWSGVDVADFDADETAVISSVLLAYGKVPHFRLTNFFQRADSPYLTTYQERGAYAPIPRRRTRRYFKELATRREEVGQDERCPRRP